MEDPSLESWSSEGGNVVVIGDAAHGMTPFQGQVRSFPLSLISLLKI